MNLATRVRNGVAALFAKAAPANLSGVDDRRGWHTLFDSERNMGDWQKDIHVDRGAVLANWALFSCMTLIAGDIGKVYLRLVEQERAGSDFIWLESFSPSFSPVLNKPNHFQTRQQFIEQWMLSKLSHGNTYVLKQRDNRGGENRGVVVAMYVLDPSLVLPLVAPDGSVYYQLGEDNLSGLQEYVPAIPASEIIHDRFNCLFHPLVGLSPIFANGLAAMQGLKIQQNSAKFFKNMSRPSGVLTGPSQISDETAKRLKTHWEANYTGDNMGKVAVLGDGLKYESMVVTPVDAQMVEQLSATAAMICSTLHVPAFKIGAGTIPAGQKVEDLNQIYYADCLHALMDAIQTLLREGLGLDTPKEGRTYAVHFDLDDLLKMDSTTLTGVLKEQVGAGIMAPNEARLRLNHPPVEGGETPYLQVQNYSIAALAKRDSQADPFAKPAQETAPAPQPVPTAEEQEKQLSEIEVMALTAELLKKAMRDG